MHPEAGVPVGVAEAETGRQEKSQSCTESAASEGSCTALKVGRWSSG